MNKIPNPRMYNRNNKQTLKEVIKIRININNKTLRNSCDKNLRAWSLKSSTKSTTSSKSNQ